MTEESSKSTSGQQTGTSAFSDIRNAKDLKEVMSWLEEENVAAIVEALRIEKWANELIPIYLTHPNHIIRYEIACSSAISESDLGYLTKDREQIVRQGAQKNLRARRLQKASSERKILEKAESVPKVEATKKSEEKVEESKSSNETKSENSKKKRKLKVKKGKK